MLVALNGVKFDSKNASYIIVPVCLVQPGFSTAPRAGELLGEPFEFTRVVYRQLHDAFSYNFIVHPQLQIQMFNSNFKWELNSLLRNS